MFVAGLVEVDRVVFSIALRTDKQTDMDTYIIKNKNFKSGNLKTATSTATFKTFFITIMNFSIL